MADFIHSIMEPSFRKELPLIIRGIYPNNESSNMDKEINSKVNLIIRQLSIYHNIFHFKHRIIGSQSVNAKKERPFIPLRYYWRPHLYNVIYSLHGYNDNDLSVYAKVKVEEITESNRDSEDTKVKVRYLPGKYVDFFLSKCFTGELDNATVANICSLEAHSSFEKEYAAFERERLEGSKPLSAIIGEDDAEKRDCLFSLIDFLCNISPLHPLGFFLLHNRYFDTVSLSLDNNGNISPKEQFILTRGVTESFAAAQEGLFRSLKAMAEERMLNINGRNFIPLDLKFERKSSFYLPTPTLYVADETGQLHFFDLEANDSILIAKKRKKKKEKEKEKEKVENTATAKLKDAVYKVLFFVDPRQTDYLERQISHITMEKYAEPPDWKIIIDSPYYSESLECEVRSYDEIKVNIDFAHFFEERIRGFGDFALLIGSDIAPSNSRTQVKGGHKKYGDPCDSLLQPYNSAMLMYRAFDIIEMSSSECQLDAENMIISESCRRAYFDEYNNNGIETRAIIDKFYNPTHPEVCWLNYVLNTYEKISALYLGKETLDDLRKKIKGYIDSLPKTAFDPFAKISSVSGWEEFAEGADKVIILGEHSEFAELVHSAIKQNQVLTYKWRRSESLSVVCSRIYPYIIDYSLLDQSSRLMAYSLDEMRIVAINLAQISVFHDIEQSDCENSLSFSEKLCLYYASILREYELACWEKKYSNASLIKLFNSTVEDTFRYNKEGNGKRLPLWIQANYNDTCLSELAERFVYYYKEVMKCFCTDMSCEFLKRAFGQFYFKKLEKSLSEYKEDECKDGIPPFGVQELQHKTALLFLIYVYSTTIRVKYKKQSDQGAEGLNTKDAIENEIRQAAERFRTANVSFNYNEFIIPKSSRSERRDQQSRIIRQVVDIFAEYECTVLLKKQGGHELLGFDIVFERFDFRKIHQRLLALSDRIDIDSIQPQATRDIIHKRLKNKEDIERQLIETGLIEKSANLNP